jgi:hypothetical protein
MLAISLGTATALSAGFGTGPAAAAGNVPEIAPYFETTGAHTGNLNSAITGHGLKSFTAAFVLGSTCTPTWDNGKAIAQATTLNALVSNAKARGAVPIISFGGQQGIELATSCTAQTKLVAAYTSVIHKFGVTKIDFDIEGKAAVDNTAADTRRFKAIKTLEQKFPKLEVSVTIQIGPSGIEPENQFSGDGKKFLRLAKTLGARLDVVNIMTMDYGDAEPDMGALAKTSARNTVPQLQAIFGSSYGYNHLGITPMIGQNDSAGEVFSYDDSQAVVAFAKLKGVHRLAFWNLNRDQSCGSADQRPNDCSEESQAPLDYTDGFLN